MQRERRSKHVDMQEGFLFHCGDVKRSIPETRYCTEIETPQFHSGEPTELKTVEIRGNFCVITKLDFYYYLSFLTGAVWLFV